MGFVIVIKVGQMHKKSTIRLRHAPYKITQKDTTFSVHICILQDLASCHSQYRDKLTMQMLANKCKNRL